MVLTGSSDGPPDSVQVTIQDSDGGLGTITVLTDVNANISIPAFTSGTTAPVIVSATEINPMPFSFGLEAVDLAGNATVGSFTGGDVDPRPVVPKPATILLLGTGLLSTARSLRRTRR
jgi:hypothetical protein